MDTFGSRALWGAAVVVAAGLWWQHRAADTIGEVPLSANLDGADPDDILIDFVDSTSDARIAEIGRMLGLAPVLVSAQAADEQLYRAHIDPARRTELLRALVALPEVQIAEPDAAVSLINGIDIEAETFRAPPDNQTKTENYPNDPKYKYQWHFGQIGMKTAWPLADGGGTVVAVLDTGVAYENFEKFHALPDLAGIEFVHPYDFVDNDKHANDDHGHGSHVTGTIAQATHNGIGVAGIARNVKIMPLKVLSGSGGGSVAGIADAIRYAADNGAKVINMSLGGPFPSRILGSAVDYAHKKGVTIVAAAGNESRGRVGYPAAYPGAIAVAATQFDETTTFYSNYGKAIDIAAPGGNMRVDQNNDGVPDGVLQNTIVIGDPTKDDYFAFMGTSMAAPHVAGVAALLVGEGMTHPRQVEALLQKTAKQPANGYTTERYGAGILDAAAAVTAARGDRGNQTGLLALLLGAASIASARRRGLGAVTSSRAFGTFGVGALMGATGLWFLPALAPAISSLPLIEMLTRGLPAWDIAILGPAAHGNALFYSALVPVAALVLGYGRASLRAPLAGLAVGVAAHLLTAALLPGTNVQFMPDLVDKAWLMINAVACLWFAHLALRK